MGFLKPPKYSNFFIQSNYIHHEYLTEISLKKTNIEYPTRLRKELNEHKKSPGAFLPRGFI